MDRMHRPTALVTYLSDEALERGELVHGDGHLTHVVGDVRGAAERVGDHGVRQRLVERLQALKIYLPTDAHFLAWL